MFAESLTSLSFWEIFKHADFFVQAVMILLFILSVWSWSFMYSHFTHLKKIKRLSQEFQHAFWKENASLRKLYESFSENPQEPLSESMAVILQKLPSSASKTNLSKSQYQDTKLLIEEELDMLAVSRMHELVSPLSSLSFVGSSSVFIGLFGTVWGIMQSFQGIAQTGSTSLSVVAPAISEALLATALGLFVAIPANFGYNKLSSMAYDYKISLQIFSQKMLLFFLHEISKEKT